MEAPSTSDFEEDEAEIAERGARAWHFFEGGLHFSLHRIHTREKKEQSLLVVFCVRKAAIESALFSSAM